MNIVYLCNRIALVYENISNTIIPGSARSILITSQQ